MAYKQTEKCVCNCKGAWIRYKGAWSQLWRILNSKGCADTGN